MKLALILLLLFITPINAQVTSNNYDMDLPVAPATFGSLVLERNSEDSDEDEDDGDDPRDTPPPTFYGEEVETETDSVFYVIDISCSMGAGSGPYSTLDGTIQHGNRLDRAKAELMRSVADLSSNFMFNIIAFDCGYRIWSFEGMKEATSVNKVAALNWIGCLREQGGTGTGPATSLALTDRENMTIILLTDGGPNCGANGHEGHRRMISRHNLQGATINVFGISASGSLKAFCQSVASDSGGAYFDIL